MPSAHLARPASRTTSSETERRRRAGVPLREGRGGERSEAGVDARARFSANAKFSAESFPGLSDYPCAFIPATLWSIARQTSPGPGRNVHVASERRAGGRSGVIGPTQIQRGGPRRIRRIRRTVSHSLHRGRDAHDADRRAMRKPNVGDTVGSRRRCGPRLTAYRPQPESDCWRSYCGAWTSGATAGERSAALVLQVLFEGRGKDVAAGALTVGAEEQVGRFGGVGHTPQ